MFAGVDAPTPTAAAAASLLDGLADDLEDILPDPNAMAALWRIDPKAFKRAFFGAVAA